MSDIRSITYEAAYAVTLSDSTDDPSGPFAALYTGAGGDIKVTPISGPAIVLVGTPAGIIMPIAVRRVWSTGTAATSIIGLLSLPYKRAVSS